MRLLTELEAPVTNGPLVRSQANELRAHLSTPVTAISSGKEAGTSRSVVRRGPGAGTGSAAPGQCDGSVRQVVKFVKEVNGTPMGGPNETRGWAHPDGKQANQVRRSSTSALSAD